MTKFYVPLALVAIFAASPAAAQFAGFSQPQMGSGSFTTANPTGAIPAGEGAKINRIRSGAGADQNRPVKVCDTDIAYGANNGNRPQLTSRQDNTYVRSIEVYSGGFCSGSNRRKQF